jgi:uncharacterized protein (TIGR03000 family)
VFQNRINGVHCVVSLGLLGILWSPSRAAAQYPVPSAADPFTVPFASSIDDPNVYGRYIQGPGFLYTPAELRSVLNPPIAPASAPSEQVAYIHVRVAPPHARISFQGSMTSSIGSTRLFVSPPLNQGETYQYDIHVSWMENGQLVNQDRTIPVRAGDRLSIVFREPANGVGSSTLRTVPGSAQ